MEISRVCKQGLLNCINFAHRLNHIRRVPYREMASNNDNDIIEKCKADAARLAVNENISVSIKSVAKCQYYDAFGLTISSSHFTG